MDSLKHDKVCNGLSSVASSNEAQVKRDAAISDMVICSAWSVEYLSSCSLEERHEKFQTLLDVFHTAVEMHVSIKKSEFIEYASCMASLLSHTTLKDFLVLWVERVNHIINCTSDKADYMSLVKASLKIVLSQNQNPHAFLENEILVGMLELMFRKLDMINTENYQCFTNKILWYRVARLCSSKTYLIPFFHSRLVKDLQEFERNTDFKISFIGVYCLGYWFFLLNKAEIRRSHEDEWHAPENPNREGPVADWRKPLVNEEENAILCKAGESLKKVVQIFLERRVPIWQLKCLTFFMEGYGWKDPPRLSDFVIPTTLRLLKRSADAYVLALLNVLFSIHLDLSFLVLPMFKSFLFTDVLKENKSPEFIARVNQIVSLVTQHSGITSTLQECTLLILNLIVLPTTRIPEKILLFTWLIYVFEKHSKYSYRYLLFPKDSVSLYSGIYTYVNDKSSEDLRIKSLTVLGLYLKCVGLTPQYREAFLEIQKALMDSRASYRVRNEALRSLCLALDKMIDSEIDPLFVTQLYEMFHDLLVSRLCDVSAKPQQRQAFLFCLLALLRLDRISPLVVVPTQKLKVLMDSETSSFNSLSSIAEASQEDFLIHGACITEMFIFSRSTFIDRQLHLIVPQDEPLTDAEDHSKDSSPSGELSLEMFIQSVFPTCPSYKNFYKAVLFFLFIYMEKKLYRSFSSSVYPISQKDFMNLSTSILRILLSRFLVCFLEFQLSESPGVTTLPCSRFVAATVLNNLILYFASRPLFTMNNNSSRHLVLLIALVASHTALPFVKTTPPYFDFKHLCHIRCSRHLKEVISFFSEFLYFHFDRHERFLTIPDVSAFEKFFRPIIQNDADNFATLWKWRYHLQGILVFFSFDNLVYLEGYGTDVSLWQNVQATSQAFCSLFLNCLKKIPVMKFENLHDLWMVLKDSHHHDTELISFDTFWSKGIESDSFASNLFLQRFSKSNSVTEHMTLSVPETLQGSIHEAPSRSKLVTSVAERQIPKTVDSLIKEHEMRCSKIKAETRLVCFLFQLLQRLCVINPSSFSSVHLDAFLHCSFNFLSGYLTHLAAYQCLETIVRCHVKKTQFSCILLAKVLKMVALEEKDFSCFFSYLRTNQLEPFCAKGAIFLKFILNYMINLPLDTECTRLLLVLLQQQHFGWHDPSFNSLVLQTLAKAFSCYPNLFESYKILLHDISKTCSLDEQGEQNQIQLIRFGIPETFSIREFVLTLFEALPEISPAVAPYLYVFMFGSTQHVKDSAQVLLQRLHKDTVTEELIWDVFSLVKTTQDKTFHKQLAEALACNIRDIISSSSKTLDRIFKAAMSSFLSTCQDSDRVAYIEILIELTRQRLVQTESDVTQLFVFLFHHALVNDSFFNSPPNHESSCELLELLQTLGLECIRSSPHDLQIRLDQVLENVQRHLKDLPNGLTSKARARLDEAAALFFGTVAQYATPFDTHVESILTNLLSKIVHPDTPTRQVQLKIAKIMIPLIKKCHGTCLDSDTLAVSFLHKALTEKLFVTRNGNSLALAAFVRALGLRFLKKHTMIDKLIVAAQDKQDPISRQGALLCFLSLSELLGRLFEPFVVLVLTTLLDALSDFSIPVRQSAQQAVQTIMADLSGYNITLILPRLLTQMTESHWRTKVGAIEALGAMGHSAPKQLVAILPYAVPQLCDAVADANSKVKEAAEHALERIASCITNESIRSIISTLLVALKEPGNSLRLNAALDSLLDLEFKSPVDSASLSLIIPLVIRGLRERQAESKRKTTAILAGMVLLCPEPRQFLSYFPQVSPFLFETLIDPIPSVRCISAKTFGVIARILDEDELSKLLSLLLNKLKSSEISVERSGAAHGLAEILASLEKEKLCQLLPQLLHNAEHLQAHVREGYIGIFVFLPVSLKSRFPEFIPQILPVLLRCLASEVESLRDLTFRAAEVLVSQFASTHSVLILPPLEEGMFNSEWKVRYSSITLLGKLIEKLLKCELDAEEKSDIKHEILSFERRTFILSLLYMTRSDSNPLVRQQSMMVWKSVVQDHGKTFKEVLPILLERLIKTLEMSSTMKQEIAARCLGNLAQRQPEMIGSEFVPRVLKLFESSSSTRVGGCLALHQAFLYVPRSLLLSHKEQIIEAIKLCACDDTPLVQKVLAECLSDLVNALGEDVALSIIQGIIHDITHPPTYSVKVADDPKRLAKIRAVGVMLTAHHDVTIRSIFQSCTGSSCDVSHVRLLTTLSQLKERRVFMLSLNRLLTPFITTLTKCLTLLWLNSSDEKQNSPPCFTPSELDLFNPPLSQQESEQFYNEILGCTKTIFSRALAFDKSGREILTMLLNQGEQVKGSSQGDEVFKKTAITKFLIVLLGLLPSEEISNQVTDLLRSPLSSCLIESFPPLVEANVEILHAVLESQKKTCEHLKTAVTLVREWIKELVQTLSKSTKDSEPFPGLSFPGTFKAIFAFFYEGFISYDLALRDTASRGLGELVMVCPVEILKPVAVKMTGPLIRTTVEKIPSSLKSSVLATLRILILRAKTSLRPLIPQLQISFCRALNDASAQVRHTALSGVSTMVELGMAKTELIALELSQTISTSHSPTMMTSSLLQALVQIFTISPLRSLSAEGSRQVIDCLEGVLQCPSKSETLRTLAIDCYALLLGRQCPLSYFPHYLQTFQSSNRAQDVEDVHIHGHILTSLVLIPAFLDHLSTDGETQTLLLDVLDRFLKDERLSFKRHGITFFSRLALGYVQTPQAFNTLVRPFLPLACETLQEFVDLSTVATLTEVLKALRLLSKTYPLTLEERICIIKPTLSCLTLAHLHVKMLSDKLLYYCLEMQEQKEVQLLNQMNPSKYKQPNGLSEAQWDTLNSYSQSVLSQLKKNSVILG